MASIKGEVEQLVKRLVTDHGCDARLSNKGGHWRVSRPGYGSVTMSRTPSDKRALNNMRADAKRILGVTF